MSMYPVTVDGLIEWLSCVSLDRGGDLSERYNYFDGNDCLLARFLKASGITFQGKVAGTYYEDADGNFVELPDPMPSIISTRPNTYEAALSRAIRERDYPNHV